MKKHAIIPIFIPHLGCPHNCVFCNQNAITARSSEITPADAERIIEDYLPTLQNRGLEEIEVSFFGGSFTGIPMDQQTAFLKVAQKYKDAGKIDKIHLSTRPDYITPEILDNLKDHGVDVIELGVQSFDEQVLKASARGHSREAVFEACSLIRSYGCFTLGIQLMIGLPGDSYEKCMASVNAAISIKPDIARLYPTVIITDTPLYEMYRRGDYVPFTKEETLRCVKDMYKALTSEGINVIRVGLKASALINDGENSRVAGDTYHPAIRQLAEGEIAKEEMIPKLNAIIEKLGDQTVNVTVSANSDKFSSVIGHKACNKEYFRKNYPSLRIKYVMDDSAAENDIIVTYE